MAGTHKIPQNVTKYESRIIGRFTAKQFIFLAIGAMGIFLIFNTPLPNPIKFALIGIIAVVSLVFSVANIQGRTTDAWISEFMHAVSMPTQLVWRKREHPPAFLLPSFSVAKTRKAGKKRTQYELEKFIELWNPSSPTSEYTKEEQAILERVREHGGLASQVGASAAPVAASTPQANTPEEETAPVNIRAQPQKPNEETISVNSINQ